MPRCSFAQTTVNTSANSTCAILVVSCECSRIIAKGTVEATKRLTDGNEPCSFGRPRFVVPACLYGWFLKKVRFKAISRYSEKVKNNARTFSSTATTTVVTGSFSATYVSKMNPYTSTIRTPAIRCGYS